MLENHVRNKRLEFKDGREKNNLEDPDIKIITEEFIRRNPYIRNKQNYYLERDEQISKET